MIRGRWLLGARGRVPHVHMARSRWKRWLLPVLTFLGICFAVVGVRHVLGKRAQEKRDQAYQRTLHAYSDTLRPGLSRAEVEDYLQSKKIQFRQMCCADRKTSSKNVYDDLVKIGQEDAPWFCNENNVYVAFQFSGQRANVNWPPSAMANDRLTEVTIFRWFEGCM